MAKTSTSILRRVVRIPILILVLLLALLVAVGPATKFVLNHYGKQLLGRRVHVEQLWLNPLTGGIKVQQLVCKEADDTEDFVTADQLYVRVRLLALFGGQVNVARVQVDSLQLSIWQQDGRFNFADLQERFATDEEKEKKPSRWKFVLGDMRLVGCGVRYADRTHHHEWAVDDINLHIPGLGVGNGQNNAGLAFDLRTGGHVAMSAGYKKQTNRYAADLQLVDISADALLPLLENHVLLGGLGARMSGNVHLDGGLDNIEDMQLRGRLEMHDLRIKDRDKDDIAAIESACLVVRRADVLRRTLDVDSLVILGVTGSYETNGEYNTLSRLLPEQNENPEDSLESQVELQTDDKNSWLADARWTAKYVLVTGYDIAYEDVSMAEDMEFCIEDVRIDGRNISSVGTNMLQVRANMSHGAQLQVGYAGSLNPKKGKHLIQMKLTGLQLKDFSALCRSYTSYPIERGVLSVESQIRIENGLLDGQNKLVAEDLKIGRKDRLSRAPYKHLPVKMCAELLRSAQGLVVLNVPVMGDVRSPQFDLNEATRRAVLKVFFGPMVGLKDKKNMILPDEVSTNDVPSDESWDEMRELLGEELTSVADADVAMSTDGGLDVAEIAEE